MELFYNLWNQSNVTSQSTKKIVLLHGMGGTGALWRPIAASLENEISILAPDQRGHGKSRVASIPAGRKETDYSPLSYGQDVMDTLKAQNFYPTWILGHSMGVRSAIAAAHLKPEWVQGLILVDLGFSGVAGGGLGNGLAQFLKLLPFQFESAEEARKFMNSHCPDSSITQYLMAVSVRNSDGKISFPFDHAALIKTIESARDVSVRTWIKDLAYRQMPILVLRGARSLVWSHEDFESERKTFTPFQSITFKEIPDAGHGLPFEQRAVFVDTLREFIARH